MDMTRIFSVSFWLQALASTFVTLCCIYIIKQVTSKVEIPVVSDIAQAV